MKRSLAWILTWALTLGAAVVPGTATAGLNVGETPAVVPLVPAIQTSLLTTSLGAPALTAGPAAPTLAPALHAPDAVVPSAASLSAAPVAGAQPAAVPTASLPAAAALSISLDARAAAAATTLPAAPSIVAGALAHLEAQMRSPTRPDGRQGSAAGADAALFRDVQGGRGQFDLQGAQTRAPDAAPIVLPTAPAFASASRTLVTPAAARWRAAALSVMLAGSLNTSRTAVMGRRYFADPGHTNATVQQLAEDNYRKAAEYVLDHYADLPLNRATSVKLNMMLTEGLVPEDIRGNPDYHRDTRPFYEWMANDAEAKGREDPLELAQYLHFNLSRLDSFPDGNGRNARLMADLALLKHGLPPAFYTDMKDYFARGNHRAKVSPEVRRAYFRDAVERGRRALNDPAFLAAEARRAQTLDDDFVEGQTKDDGHTGKPAVPRWQTLKPR
jgi:hypothetical protein